MKKIELTQGKFALVDDEDFEKINQYKWYFFIGKYAVKNITYNKKQKHLLMHRFIMNCPDGLEIDHINNNGLDNQKKNLRVVTRQQNMMNRTKSKNKSSIYKGVYIRTIYYKNKTYKYWKTSIKLNQQAINLGTFPTEHLAAMAYDIWAIELFGKFAKTNFKIVAHSNFI